MSDLKSYIKQRILSYGPIGVCTFCTEYVSKTNKGVPIIFSTCRTPIIWVLHGSVRDNIF